MPSSATPSAANAITAPARLERDSRNSNVCIDRADPSNSAANSGNPAVTHAAAGSPRNSARNAGSTNSRSIRPDTRSNSTSPNDTIHLRGAVAPAAQQRGAERQRDRQQEQHEEGHEAAEHDVVGGECVQAVVVAQRDQDHETGADNRPDEAGDRVAAEHGRALVADHLPREAG